MLLRQLDYFIKVVDNKSFTKAADAAFISQSAVSQQIRALEQELGVKLLRRHNRSFSLTSAGNYLYRHGPGLLAAADELQQATINVGKEEVSELALGYPQNYDGVELSAVVSAFSQLYPQLQLTVRAQSHADLLQNLANETLDLALVGERGDVPTDFQVQPVLAARRFVEVAQISPLAQLPTVSLAHLSQLPCIVIANEQRAVEEARYYREQIGVLSEFRFVNSLTEAQILVAANQGYLLVDQVGTWRPAAPQIARVALQGSETVALTQRYVLAWRPALTTSMMTEFGQLLTAKLRKP